MVEDPGRKSETGPDLPPEGGGAGDSDADPDGTGCRQPVEHPAEQAVGAEPVAPSPEAQPAPSIDDAVLPQPVAGRSSPFSFLTKWLTPRRPAPPQAQDGGWPAAAVRGDLVAGCELLGMLAARVTVGGRSRPGGLVIAAPHHGASGTPLSDGHDVNTGPIAERLAERLGAKSVVVSELRTFIDINKDPLEMEQAELGNHLGREAFREADRRLKLYYQSQLFADNPLVVVEIHGHVRGNYDIEVATGFALDSKVPQDAPLIKALGTFKEVLAQSMAESRVLAKRPPSVGAYPLDSEVRFSATGTHTFNKIERLRELGVNAAGLHIELHQRLRPAPDEGRKIRDAVVDCLEPAIREFGAGVKRPTDFEFKTHLFEDFSFDRGVTRPASGDSFVVQPIPREMIGKGVALFRSDDVAELALAEGAGITLSRNPDFENGVRLRVAVGDTARSGRVGIGKKERDRIGVDTGDRVFVGRAASTGVTGLVLGYVADVDAGSSRKRVTVSDTAARELAERMTDGKQITIGTATGRELGVEVATRAELPHERAVRVSGKVARELAVTYGDLVCFVGESSGEEDPKLWAPIDGPEPGEEQKDDEQEEGRQERDEQERGTSC